MLSLRSTNMDKPKLKRYSNPIDPETGKRYFVPCVAKNKNALVYYVLGVSHCAENILRQLPEQTALRTDLELNSLRFNDILPNGKTIHSLTKADYDEMEKEVQEKQNDNHPDNQVKVEEQFFIINCPNCGNPYVFKSPDEIPEETFFCGLCERVLIDYTGVNDWEYEYYEA